MSGLSVDGVGLRLGGRTVLDAVDVAVPHGTIHGLIGPNGAGKSSLLRVCAGLYRPDNGQVRFAGDDILAMPRRQRARVIAITEQSSDSDVRLDAFAVVMLGRIPFQSALQSGPSANDIAAVENALAIVDMAHLARRDYHTLSGGEQQRLHIARALAQQPRLLLLDEPTNHLDIEAQVSILRLLRQAARTGTTIVIAIHDLNLAADHCDEITVMAAGRVVAQGDPCRVVTAALLRDVYRVDATILTNPSSGRPLVAYHAIAGASPRQRASL